MWHYFILLIIGGAVSFLVRAKENVFHIDIKLFKTFVKNKQNMILQEIMLENHLLE